MVQTGCAHEKHFSCCEFFLDIDHLDSLYILFKDSCKNVLVILVCPAVTADYTAREWR